MSRGAAPTLLAHVRMRDGVHSACARCALGMWSASVPGAPWGCAEIRCSSAPERLLKSSGTDAQVLPESALKSRRNGRSSPSGIRSRRDEPPWPRTRTLAGSGSTLPPPRPPAALRITSAALASRTQCLSRRRAARSSVRESSVLLRPLLRRDSTAKTRRCEGAQPAAGTRIEVSGGQRKPRRARQAALGVRSFRPGRDAWNIRSWPRM